MFRPNLTAQLMRRQAKRTVHGKTLYLPAVSITLAVVSLGTSVEDSSVRADSSASRGASEIETLKAKLLIPPYHTVTAGDVILVQGYRVEVNGVAPRNNIVGRLDHWEVTGDIKSAE